MAVYHCLKLVPPSLVALQRESCRHNELVCYSSESAYNYYHRLAFGFFLYNAFKAQNAFYGTYRCSAKLQYFHFPVN